MPATGCIWHIRVRSRNTRDSNTAATLPMRAIWRNCCGWVCWQRATSIHARSAGRGTWRANACSWCATDRTDPVDREHHDAADREHFEGEAVKRLTAQQVDEFAFAPDVALAMEANRAVSEALTTNRSDRKAPEKSVGLRPEYRLLKSMPGIGQTLATTIMLEMGSIGRFHRWGTLVRTVAVWTACGRAMARKRAKATRGTGTSTWPGPLWKRRFALRYCPEAKSFYERKKRKANRVLAIKARRTSWRERATTCCGSKALRCRSMFRVSVWPRAVSHASGLV